jgi:hypothetical protein
VDRANIRLLEPILDIGILKLGIISELIFICNILLIVFREKNRFSSQGKEYASKDKVLKAYISNIY